MTTSWDADTAVRWQNLMSEWEEARAEHELAGNDIAAGTPDSPATSAQMQRLARAQARLDRLQADIDQLIAQRGLSRRPEDREFVVAALSPNAENAQLDDSAVPKTSGSLKKG